MARLLERGLELLRDRLKGRGFAVAVPILPALLGRDALAAIPVALEGTVAHTAAALAAGAGPLSSLVPAAVAGLAEGVLREMYLQNLKLGGVLALILGVLGGGIGVLSYRGDAAEPRPVVGKGPDAPQPKSAQPAPARRFTARAALDVYQIVDGQPHPRYLGSTQSNPGVQAVVNVPAGAVWYVQPSNTGCGLGGIGAIGFGGLMPGGVGALGIGGGAVGFAGGGGGQLGQGGGVGLLGQPPQPAQPGQGGKPPMPPAGNPPAGMVGNIGFGGGALGVGGGAGAGGAVGGAGFGGALGALGGRGIGGAGMLGLPGMFGARDLQALIPELKKQNVPGLSLENVALTDDDFAALRNVPGLQVLLLRTVPITDRSVPTLLSLKELRILGLEGTGMTAQGLASLKDLPALHTVRLGGKSITDAALKAVGGVKKLSTVRLDWADVHPQGLEALAKQPGLKTVELRGPFTDKDLEVLRHAPNLETLRLHQTAITPEGLKLLQSFPKLTSLSVSSLFGWEGPQFTGAYKVNGAAIQLKFFTTQQILNPDGELVQVPAVALGDEGLKHLAELKKLTDLYIGSAALTNAGLEHLKGLTGLQRLGIFSEAVTDRGLAVVKDLKQLDRLDLRGTQMTTGLATTLRGLPALRTLLSNLCPGDPRYRTKLDFLQRSLPACKVWTLQGAPGAGMLNADQGLIPGGFGGAAGAGAGGGGFGLLGAGGLPGPLNPPPGGPVAPGVPPKR
jgi:internalin A